MIFNLKKILRKEEKILFLKKQQLFEIYKLISIKMLYPQENFASNFTLYSDILKGVISILKSAILVKDPVYEHFCTGHSL